MLPFGAHSWLVDLHEEAHARQHPLVRVEAVERGHSGLGCLELPEEDKRARGVSAAALADVVGRALVEARGVDLLGGDGLELDDRHLRRQLAENALAQLARLPVPPRPLDVQPVDVRPCEWLRDSGLRAWGFGFRVQGSPIRCTARGCTPLEFGGSGFRVQGSGLPLQCTARGCTPLPKGEGVRA